MLNFKKKNIFTRQPPKEDTPPELEEQYPAGNLLADLSLKDSRTKAPFTSSIQFYAEHAIS